MTPRASLLSTDVFLPLSLAHSLKPSQCPGNVTLRVPTRSHHALPEDVLLQVPAENADSVRKVLLATRPVGHTPLPHPALHTLVEGDPGEDITVLQRVGGGGRARAPGLW